MLESTPLCQITSNSSKVVKGKYFPNVEKDGSSVCTVSEVYSAKRKVAGSHFLVCIHEKSLKAEYCNLWTAKVSTSKFRIHMRGVDRV